MVMTKTNVETIIARAQSMSRDSNTANVTKNLLLNVLYAVVDEWPSKDDEHMLNLYLVHDLRSLSHELQHIAAAYEAWDADA